MSTFQKVIAMLGICILSVIVGTSIGEFIQNSRNHGYDYGDYAYTYTCDYDYGDYAYSDSCDAQLSSVAEAYRTAYPFWDPPLDSDGQYIGWVF